MRTAARKWPRRLAAVGALGTAAYLYDHQYQASAVARSARTAYVGLLCTLDYKFNFNPRNATKIEALHERVASRLKWVIDTNQGLYLKLGQALGLQAALLPRPYREAFGHVFDRAPAVDYAEVEGVFREDLGALPDDLFLSFDKTPIASASIAQVHRATIMIEGKPVHAAVKVQKPAIRMQMSWDLASYRALMWVAEKLFDMPMYFVAKYVSEQMRLETSFAHESSNARRCAELLAQTPQLRDDVYVPRVYGKTEGCPESNRIMVMEWVEAKRLNDTTALADMGISPRSVMDIAISLNAAMTFVWGFVHCDPHPGNLLVRPHPAISSSPWTLKPWTWFRSRSQTRPQLVVIDHGLYIPLPKQFREEYCSLWRSLFVLDIPTIEDIARKWGIAVDANLFASAILLRPFRMRESKEPKDAPQLSEYEQQVALKQRIKSMLENEQLVPRELIFLTRCQRMMQANNQILGSPSSRVNLTAKWASVGYARSAPPDATWTSWLRTRMQSVIFRITLGIVDLAFLGTRVKQYLLKGQGWEDQLQKQFEKMAREELGIEIDDTVFMG